MSTEECSVDYLTRMLVRVGSIVKGLLCNHEGLCSVSRTRGRQAGMVPCACYPKVGHMFLVFITNVSDTHLVPNPLRHSNRCWISDSLQWGCSEVQSCSILKRVGGAPCPNVHFSRPAPGAGGGWWAKKGLVAFQTEVTTMVWQWTIQYLNTARYKQERTKK